MDAGELDCDRSLGRPKEWNGESSGFDDFAFKFSNWLSGFLEMQGDFWKESVNMGQPIVCDNAGATRKDRSQRRSNRFASSRGWQSSEFCIRHHSEKQK